MGTLEYIDNKVFAKFPDSDSISFAEDYYKRFNKEFCKCFIYLKNNTTEKERKLLKYIEQLPEIYTIIKCVGSWDIELEFTVDNFTQFHSIMRDLKNKFDIIRGYESVIISQEYGINYYNFI